MVHDALDHGAELLFEELVGVGATDLSAMVHQKKQLGVFREIDSPVDSPDYGCGEIMRDFEFAQPKISIDS